MFWRKDEAKRMDEGTEVWGRARGHRQGYLPGTNYVIQGSARLLTTLQAETERKHPLTSCRVVFICTNINMNKLSCPSAMWLQEMNGISERKDSSEMIWIDLKHLAQQLEINPFWLKAASQQSNVKCCRVKESSSVPGNCFKSYFKEKISNLRSNIRRSFYSYHVMNNS